MPHFKYRRIVALITLIALAINAVSAQTVFFGPSDFDNLGELEQKVLPAFEELANAKNDYNAGIKYTDLALQAISSAGDAINAQNKVSEILTMVGAMNNILGAAQSRTFSDLANGFSAVDTSGISSSLSSLNSALQVLDSQVSNPILPPSDLLYYAVIISARAREDVAALRQQAISGRVSLQNASARISSYSQLMRQLSAGSRQASRLAYEITNLFFKLSEEKIINLLTYPFLASLYPLENQFQEIAGQADTTISRLTKVQSQVELRIKEMTDLILNLEAALGAAPLPATWTTSADVGPTNAFYALSFENRSFTSPATEIDGRFILGNLVITNYITTGGGDQTTTATIRFEVERRVDAPGLGIFTTPGLADFTMYYTATTNTDDPDASADYFTVPSLGLNLHIRETDTVRFIIYGQYNSPLRIAAIELAPGSTGGFISEITPSDHTPPVTSVNLSGEKGDNGWYKSAVQVNLSAVDNGGKGETAATYFTIDGGYQQSYTGPFKLAMDGKRNITFWSVDQSGNEETPRTIPISIDSAPPAVKFGRSVSRNGFALWANSPVDIPFIVTDNLSGVVAQSTASPLQLGGEGGNQTSSITVRDAAGNTAVISSPGINIDETAPQISALAHPVATASSSIKGRDRNILINIVGSIKDDLSGAGPGVGSYSISDNFGNLYPGGSFPIDADGLFLFPLRLRSEGNRQVAKDHKFYITLNADDQARNAASITVLAIAPE